jgi:hypothetical protein
MATKSKHKRDPLGNLRFNEFFGPYAELVRNAQGAERALRELEELRGRAMLPLGFDAQPAYGYSPECKERVLGWWQFRLLRIAASDGNTERFKRMLYYFLRQLDLHLPTGVLTEFVGKPGRPKAGEPIRQDWERRGCPLVDKDLKDELARAHYAAEYAKAQKATPVSRDNKIRRLRDRVGANLSRIQKPATK